MDKTDSSSPSSDLPPTIIPDVEELDHLAKRREQRKNLKHVIDVRKVILDTCMYLDSYVNKKSGETIKATKMDIDRFCNLMNEDRADDNLVFMKSGWQNGGAVKVVKRA